MGSSLFSSVFRSYGMPHGFCFLWNPGLLWLHVASDSLIAVAYFLLPVALVRIARRRRDIPFNGMFFLFAAFIAACGITHVMEVVTLWHPVYWLSGGFKAVTAGISVATFVALARLPDTVLSKFERLFEFSPDAIFVADREGRIRDANARAEEIFGHARGELLGRSVEDLMPERFRRHHPEHVHDFNGAPRARAMGAGLELLGLRKDGSEVPIDIMLKPVEMAEGAMVMSFVRDVSEQRGAQTELRRVNHRLNSVLESTIVCVLAIDREWKIEYMNHNANELLSQGRDLIGTRIWESFPKMEEESERNLRHVMETRESMRYESYYAALDLWTTVKASPWEDGGLTIFFTDVSAQVRLQQELDAERAQGAQRTETLARLSSSLAHEIKNPLAIIHARASDLAELAADGEAGPREIAKACGSIAQMSERALRILRGVAAMARVGTHDPMQPADVAAMVDQAVELVEGRFRVAGIRLEARVAPELPRLECREVQISQILVNLLNNAFDAVDGDTRSERWVRVEVQAVPDVEQQDMESEGEMGATGPMAAQGTGQMEIAVVDGGPGIPEEIQHRLMETFFTTKPLGAGIGIGLSVSRSIAEDHGGHLELGQREGHTCFRLLLPLRAACDGHDGHGVHGVRSEEVAA